MFTCLFLTPITSSLLGTCRDINAAALPASLTGLSSLTSLDLSGNAFEGLVADSDGSGGLAALARLPSLRRLLLRCCQLPCVPAKLCELSQLTHLDLSRNQLVELPSEMSGLRGLVELVAEGNCFPRIPQASPAGQCWAGGGDGRPLPECCRWQGRGRCRAGAGAVCSPHSRWSAAATTPTSASHAARPTARPPARLPGPPCSSGAQVLCELVELQVADLSFNIYMEAASSLLHLLDSDTNASLMGLECLRRLDLRHGPARRSGDGGGVLGVGKRAVAPDARAHACSGACGICAGRHRVSRCPGACKPWPPANCRWLPHTPAGRCWACGRRAASSGCSSCRVSLTGGMPTTTAAPLTGRWWCGTSGRGGGRRGSSRRQLDRQQRARWPPSLPARLGRQSFLPVLGRVPFDPLYVLYALFFPTVHVCVSVREHLVC